MTSLYGRLLRVGSASRDRLEDFLTEVLGDLLNRLPHDTQIAFCRDFLLRDISEEERRRWLTLLPDGVGLEWQTQVQIEVAGAAGRKRPDLVLYSGGRPALVIECKVAAGFTSGTLRKRRGRPKQALQLHFYDEWLAQKTGSAAALVVLTHLSEPPADFTASNSDYKTKVRAVRRWAELHGYLAALAKASEGNAVATYIENLLEFLRERQLMSEEPTLQDLTTARSYLGGGAHARLRAALATVERRVRSSFPKLNATSFAPTELESEQSYGLIYTGCDTARGVSVWWGFYFGQDGADYWSDQLDPPASLQEGVFVEIEADRWLSRPESGRFAEWHFPTSSEDDDLSVVKFVGFDRFGISFTEEFAAWVTSALKEAEEIVGSGRAQRARGSL